jgi:hypothetical protein
MSEPKMSENGLRELVDELRKYAWDDSGLCIDPDLDDLAERFEAAALAAVPASGAAYIPCSTHTEIAKPIEGLSAVPFLSAPSVPAAAPPSLDDKDGWVYDPDKKLREIREKMKTQDDELSKGTFTCPICGYDKPHHHEPETVEIETLVRPAFEKTTVPGGGFMFGRMSKNPDFPYSNGRTEQLWQHFLSGWFAAKRAIAAPSVEQSKCTCILGVTSSTGDCAFHVAVPPAKPKESEK